MKNTSKNINISDYYFGLLSNLNADSKLDLITRLSDSLKTTAQPKATSLKNLFGAFDTIASAEEIITDLREARNFNRAIEDL